MRELRKVPLLVALFLPAGALVHGKQLRTIVAWLLAAGDNCARYSR